MKRTLSWLLLLAMCLSLFACTQAGPAEDTTAATTTAATTTAATTAATTAPPPVDPVPQPLDKGKSYKILFIGNSHTYKNDMPASYFKKIAQQMGYTVTVKSDHKGGYTLEEHLDPNGETWSKINQDITNGGYDFVVIQEQLTRPATHPAKFYASVRTLVQKIRDAGATPIIYQTWGGKPGNNKLNGTGYKTSEELNYRVAASHATISKELDVAIAYAGLAFIDIDRNHSAINLYADDGYHPSAAGSYLAALTIAATIFHVDPSTVAWTWNGGQTAENAKHLQEAARDAIFNTPEIPKEYYPAA